jgi:3-dehydroquinate synthase
MKKINIDVNTGSSLILINEKLCNLHKYISSEKVVIITDKIVQNYYGKFFLYPNVIEIGVGEKVKNLDTLRYIYKKLTDFGLDRSSFIVGIGGGVVCDIAGFAASTYLRGIRFVFVPSTLLAQVDAGIGGKNGVNFEGYKNIIGVINQPEFVICDTDLLKSLPEKEIICGFAEIVKCALIKNASLFSYFEENYKKALKLDYEVITNLIYESILIKSSIVNRDNEEKGERKLLNFGHTMGHAIEITANLRHGEAVSIGMIIASIISKKKGLLSSYDINRIKNLLGRLKLPALPQFNIRVNIKKALNALQKDKKRIGNNIDFILLNAIGTAFIEKISINELCAVIDSLVMD